MTRHSFFLRPGIGKMPSPWGRLAFLALACSVFLLWALFSFCKLSDHQTYGPQVRLDQTTGPVEPIGGDHADVLIRHARRGLDGLVPDPALFSLLASVAPARLGNTAVHGHTPSAAVTPRAAFAIMVTVTATTTITRTKVKPAAGYDTQFNTLSAGDATVHNVQDSGMLATTLGHDSSVPVRPTTQPSAFGWSFAGCWADQPHQPVLAAFPATELESMTNEACVRHCFVHGYTLAATSFGKKCHCGQFLNGTQKLDSQCGSPCLGDHSEICGGDWALSCYSPDGQARGWARFGEQPLPDILEPPIVKSLAAGAVEFTVMTSLRRAFPTPGADAGSLMGQLGHVTQHPRATLPSGVGPSTACVGSGVGAGPRCASDEGGTVTAPDMASNPTVTLHPGSFVSPKRNAGPGGFPCS